MKSHTSEFKEEIKTLGKQQSVRITYKENNVTKTLTDSQAMETLGETIGKYVTINANIVNSMNGRVISRQLQRIQNEKSFAYNG